MNYIRDSSGELKSNSGIPFPPRNDMGVGDDVLVRSVNVVNYY